MGSAGVSRRCNRLRSAGAVLTVSALAFMTQMTSTASTNALEGIVQDDKGKPVRDAVVFVMPVGADPAPGRRTRVAVMDQQDKLFVPQVLPIEIGMTVNFPNKDNIKHHVYSFSPPKKFELPLYGGQPAKPIAFDKPGVVVLGCNIHDWMIGYIVVLQTPYFTTTDSRGGWQLDALAPGEYDARAWHPLMRQEPDVTTQRLAVSTPSPAPLRFVIALKRDTRPVRPLNPGYDRGASP